MKWILILATMLFAQQVTVDLANLSPQARNAVIDANKSGVVSNITTGDIEKYAAIGQAVGTAFKEVCKTLNVELNEFIKTPAGKITMFMVAWKIFGQDFVHLFGGLLSAIALAIVWIFVFRYFYGYRKKWKYVDGKKTDEYELVRFQFIDRDWAPVPATSLIITGIIIITITLVSVFGF